MRSLSASVPLAEVFIISAASAEPELPAVNIAPVPSTPNPAYIVPPPNTCTILSAEEPEVTFNKSAVTVPVTSIPLLSITTLFEPDVPK